MSRPIRATAGEVSVPAGTPMKYAHGQHAAYVLDRCRCIPCGAANTAYEKGRAASMVPAYIDAQPARDHLAWLATQGIGLKTVAKVCGVAQGTLWKLVYGRDGRPSRRIRPATAEAIMKVGLEDRAPGARVPAETTWALLDEMIAAGVPRVRLAEAIGNGHALQVSRDLVTMANARLIAEVYQQWHAGEITFTRIDRWGNSTIVRPSKPPTSRLLPAGVKPDMRRLRSLKVVSAGEVYSPGYRDRAPAPESELPIPRPVIGEWRNRARCRGVDAWVFFPTKHDTVAIDKAKKWCAECPVTAQCLAAHIDEPDGIFGGLTVDERRALRRADDLVSAVSE